MFVAASILAGVGSGFFALGRHLTAIKVERAWPRSFDEFLSRDGRRSELMSSFIGFFFFTGALLEADFQQRNPTPSTSTRFVRVAKFLSGVGMFATAGFFVGAVAAELQ